MHRINAILFLVLVSGCSGPKGGQNYQDQLEAFTEIYGKPVERMHRFLVGGEEVGEMTPDMQMAVRQSETFVSTRLNHPSTMESRNSYDALVVEFKDGTYLVRSSVSAKNSFGVADDVAYEAMVSESGGSWSLIGLETGDGADLAPKQD